MKVIGNADAPISWLIPTQHFGDLHVPLAEFLLTGPGKTFCPEDAFGVNHDHQLISAELKANEQVENANC